MEPTPDTSLRRASAAAVSDLSPSAIDELLLEAAATSSDEELGWSCMSFRLRLLEACGFSATNALALAIRPEIGLDRPLGLVRGGCSPDVAAEILL
jgi:hypothetical protein